MDCLIQELLIGDEMKKYVEHKMNITQLPETHQLETDQTEAYQLETNQSKAYHHDEHQAKTQPRSSAFYRHIKHKTMMIISGIVLLLILLSITLIPLFISLDPTTSDPMNFSSAPSKQHLLGTDSVGRDVFARLLYGGRVSLAVGIFSVLIAATIGAPLGILAGYFKGLTETLIMRSCDIFMSVPSMIIILVLVSVIGPSIHSVTIVIGVMGWTTFARLAYANTLSVSNKEYVQSATTMGASHLRIICKHILPNIFSPLLTAATFMLAQSIITESGLSFLGMGVQIPQASWGNMLYDAQSISVLSTKPWQWLPPGLSLVILVMSINFVGDGIRDALNPKLRK